MNTEEFTKAILEGAHKALEEISDEALTFGIMAIMDKEKEIGTYKIGISDSKKFYINSEQAIKVLMKFVSQDFIKKIEEMI